MLTKIFKKLSLIFSNQQGLGLSQLIVATGIFAFATTISAVNYDDYLAAARDAQRQGNIHQVRTALYMYSVDHGSFPLTGLSEPSVIGWQEMAQALENNKPNPIMPQVPLDPLNEGDYQFKYSSDGATFKITYQTEDPADESPRISWGL